MFWREERFGQSVVMVAKDSLLSQTLCSFTLAVFGKPSKPENVQEVEFPAALPATCMRQHLIQMKQSQTELVALEKTDGVRHLLILYQNCAAFTDRSMAFWLVPLYIAPHLLHGTVLDGEIAQHTDGSFRYCIFDCLAYAGDMSISVRPYTERMDYAAQILKDIRFQSECGPHVTIAANSFMSSCTERKCEIKMECKPLYTPSQWLELAKQATTGSVRGFQCDGIILVPVRAAATVARAVKKIKNAGLNTIDLMVRVVPSSSSTHWEQEREHSCELYMKRSLLTTRTFPLSAFPSVTDWTQVKDHIFEFSVQMPEKWRTSVRNVEELFTLVHSPECVLLPMAIRIDRQQANARRTVGSTLACALENLLPIEAIWYLNSSST